MKYGEYLLWIEGRMRIPVYKVGSMKTSNYYINTWFYSKLLEKGVGRIYRIKGNLVCRLGLFRYKCIQDMIGIIKEEASTANRNIRYKRRSLALGLRPPPPVFGDKIAPAEE